MVASATETIVDCARTQTLTYLSAAATKTLSFAFSADRLASYKPRTFLVVGCGSAGQRHIGNLLALGQTVYCYDRDMKRMQEAVRQFKVGTLNFKAHHIPIDVFVIATPPAYHIPFAFEALEHNSHVFIEKPLSHNLDRVEDFLKKADGLKRVAQVGYQLRYSENLRQLIDKAKDATYIRAEYGNDLRCWHPDEDYHALYTTRRQEGGGIVLDASHEIDVVRWLVDSPVASVRAITGKLSNLDMDCEDTAEIYLTFANGVEASIHLDCVQRVPIRKYQVVGRQTECVDDVGSYHDMYLAEMINFINAIEGTALPNPSGWDALETLRVCMKVLGRE